jgi:hypothetical protein
MPIQLKLSDFLRTGSINILKTGTPRQQVFDLLGEPPQWSLDRHEKKWFERRYHFNRHYWQRDKNAVLARLLWLWWRVRWRFSVQFRYQVMSYAGIWKYGTLEIGFSSHKPDATIFYIQFDEIPDKQTPVQFTDGIPELLSCREDFERYLSREKLSFRQDKNYPVIDDEVCLIIECKSKVFFDSDDEFHSLSTHECR